MIDCNKTGVRTVCVNVLYFLNGPRTRGKFFHGSVLVLDHAVVRAPARKAGDSGSRPGSGLNNFPFQFYCLFLYMIYEGHPQSKERLRIHSAHLFCCSRTLVSGDQCDVEKLLRAVVCRTLALGKCRDSCDHGCTD